MRTAVLIVAGILCGVRPVFGRDACHVAVSGSDQTGDGSEENPFRTIQKAVDSCSGGRILVRPGMYGPVLVGADAFVVIESTEGPERTIIDGGHGRSCFAVAEAGRRFPSESTELRGFTLQNGFAQDGGGACGGVLCRCIIRGNAASYRGGGCAYSVLHDCLVVSNTVDGAADLEHGGVCSAGGAFCSFLYNCTVTGNRAISSRGEATGGGVNAAVGGVYNTIVWDNAANGIRDEVLWGNEYEECGSLVGVDPRFVGGYRLGVDSPARDSGDDREADRDGSDLDGNSRITGPHVDAGCYESAPCAVCISGLGTWFSGSQQTGEFTLYAVGEWELSVPDWMHVEASRGCGNTTLAFSLDANLGGTRRGTVIATADGERYESEVSQAQAADTGNGTCYGLFVGISAYRRGFSVSCPGAVRDAENYRDVFVSRGNCAASNAVMYTDESATKAAVRAKLNELAAVAGRGDTVIYTHSGHGTMERDGHGAPTSCTSILFHDDYYADWELADDLDIFTSGVRVIVILDTCHSSGMFARRSGVTANRAQNGGGARGFAVRVNSLLRRNRSFLLAADRRTAPESADIGFIAAARYSQYSFGGLDGGEFTEALCDGWKRGFADAFGDGDGKTDFHELYAYAATQAVGDFRFRNHCDETHAECLNEELLLGTLADRVIRPSPPREPPPENPAASEPDLWTDPVVAVGSADRFGAATSAKYIGWTHDQDGNLIGSFTLTVGRANRFGIARVTMAVTDLATGAKTRYRAEYDVSRGEIRGGALEGLVLGECGVVGKIGAEEASGARSGSGDTDRTKAFNDVYGKKTFAFAFSGEAGRMSGSAVFTVRFAAKGKAHIRGTLMDGSKVSVAAQMIAGDRGCALPIAFSRRRKANFGLVLWFDASRAAFKEATGIRSCRLNDGATSVDVVFAGCTEVGSTSVPSVRKLLLDGKEVATLAVSGKRIIATSGEPSAKPRLSYAGKTGLFAGSCRATVEGAVKPVLARVSGVWLGQYGVGTATMKVNGAYEACPVRIE